MTEKARLSFELNEEMLDLLAREFSVEDIVRQFKEGIKGKSPKEVADVAVEMFGGYGIELMRRSLQLGEEYSDRTYEVLREAIDSTGGHLRFPLLPQRFLEIAYLSTLDFEYLPVLENNPKRLVYLIENCKMHKTLSEQCGKELADSLPCREACLKACRTLFDAVDYPDVLVNMEASTPKEGYCQFAVRRM